MIAQLKKGGNFEAIAKQKSKDPAAKQNGGDMGWGNLGVMAKPLADTLKPLGKGQYTQQPFKSDLAGTFSRWKTCVMPRCRSLMK